MSSIFYNTDVLTCLIGGGGMHKTGAAEVAAVILVLELRALHQPGGVAYGADQSALSLQVIIIITLITEADF